MMAKRATQAAMMTRRSALGLALTAALPLAAGIRQPLAAAEPVPNTWMYAGNAARTGVFPGPGPDLDKEVIELWRIDKRQIGMFVEPCGVCDGIAYYLPVPDGISAEVRPLIAVDAHTGAELWRHDPPVTDPVTSFWGQPAIANGLLIMPTRTGLLVGLDARSGEERWIFDVQGQTLDCRLAIADGVAYISDSASVNAVEVGNTAEWLWKSPLGDGTTSLVSGMVSVDDGYVVVSSVSPAPGSESEEKSTNIHVLDAVDGSELYRYQFRPVGESYRFAVSESNALYSQADAMPLDRSYFFDVHRQVRAMDITKGTRAIRHTRRSVRSRLCRRRPVFVLMETGETVWNSQLPQLVNSAVVLIDDVIYAGAAPANPDDLYAQRDRWRSPEIDPTPFDGGARVIGATGGILIMNPGSTWLRWPTSRRGQKRAGTARNSCVPPK
ncbi:MAG: PQQ-binding-like beta-propeller repeat protein [Thermomicrobiales bacterium]|nr:PQQ-binding-like beta-propeller repeat protein [Thermomicrobiales bacterium]